MSSQAVTLADVAAAAGVHPSTVSRVLSRPALIGEPTRRAVQAAREGMASRARSALESEDVAAATEQTCDKLQTKHPETRHPLPAFSFGGLPAAGRVEEAHVEEAVLSFNKGTSCGTMGLHAQHLADVLKSAHRAALLRDLTRVVQMLVDGRVSRHGPVPRGRQACCSG